MKRILILVYTLFCVHLLAAQEKLEQARAVVNEMLNVYPGISVAVGQGDEIIWSEGFGYADVATKKEVTPESKFRYYSLSKSITGMALAKLVSENKLDISKPVTDYISNLPDSYKRVTIVQLIGHTAGVRHYNKGEWMKISASNCKSAKEALNVFINDPLEFEPGTKSQYSSFGYVLLSALVEEVSGQLYYDFVQSELLHPLGIRDIAPDQSGDALQNQVSCYDKWDRKKLKAKESPSVNNTCKFGGGGLVGTAPALVKLHLAMLNGKIVEGQYRDQYYNSITNNAGESVSYAFGIGVGEKDGMKYHSHSGSAVGANCVLIIYPSSNLVVVVLGNLDSDAMNSMVGKIGAIFREQ